MLNKNLGFVIIDIEDDNMTLINERIKKVAENIYKSQSIFTIVYNYVYYYLFSYFYFYHFYKINNLFLNLKKVIGTNYSFYIFHNGIEVYGKNIKFFIPYEYILEYGNIQGHIILHVFAKFNDQNKMEFSNEITVISFSTKGYNPKIINSIKLNMDYHIIYNKMNTSAINFYHNIKKD